MGRERVGRLAVEVWRARLWRRVLRGSRSSGAIVTACAAVGVVGRALDAPQREPPFTQAHLLTNSASCGRAPGVEALGISQQAGRAYGRWMQRSEASTHTPSGAAQVHLSIWLVTRITASRTIAMINTAMVIRPPRPRLAWVPNILPLHILAFTRVGAIFASKKSRGE